MFIKRVIAAVCSCAVLCGGMAFAAPENDADNRLELFAETQVFDGGTGEENDPFLISNEGQLLLINDFLSSSFKLTNDIELTSDWKPIGYNHEYFSGVLDGAGHTIVTQNIGSLYSYSGLFAVNQGTVKRLCLKIGDGFVVKGTSYAGTIAGENEGTIENCCAIGAMNGSYYNGGLVCSNDGTIKNCYAVTSFNGGYKDGITRYNNGKISDCYYDKDVSGLTEDSEGIKSKSTLAMKMRATYKDWDFENIWGIDADINDGYPHLLAESPTEPVSTDAPRQTDEPVIDDNTVKVTDVILDKSDAGILIGETVRLTAKVLPENATYKDIKWTSSDSGIADVSDSGVVTGISEGTAQIYATSVSNSSCYAICEIKVAAKKIAVTGIEFSDNLFDNPYEVNIGRTLTLTPSVKPADATNKDIKWTSNDNSIATVVNGKVTGIAEGTTTITATTVDGGYSAGVIVKVTKPTVYVTGIALNTEQMTVDVKASKKLTAAVTPTDATDKTITFKSNNNAIANVTSDGTVTGVSPGTTLIQAISDTSSGRFIAFCTVTVPKPVVEVTSVKLDKGSLEIVEGKTVPLKAVIKPANATYQNITWSASDESIVTVSQDGYVTARGVGEAVVSATAVNGVNVTCSVTVLSSDTPAQLKVEDAAVKAGKQVPVTVSIASNPGISTFNFDLTYDHTKMYPVSYTKGSALENVNIVTPLGSQSFNDKDSVRFLCSTADSKNMDTDGDLITVVFQTKADVEYGDYTIGIVPSAFTNQHYEAINLQEDNCTLKITDYIIGDVNNDDVVDMKDSMVLGQYIAGFGVTLTPQGKRAAVSIYPDNGDNIETSEPTINDFQHLFRYLADWQVELGKN